MGFREVRWLHDDMACEDKKTVNDESIWAAANALFRVSTGRSRSLGSVRGVGLAEEEEQRSGKVPQKKWMLPWQKR